MKVTRDVIYDLLPGYFSGEISPDTRALVDEFLQQDPEFSKMLERFRAVFRAAPPAVARGEQEVFHRVRGHLQKRSELRGYVFAFGLAAVFVVIVLVARGLERGAMPWGPWVIAAAFGLTALIAGIQWYQLDAREGGAGPR